MTDFNMWVHKTIKDVWESISINPDYENYKIWHNVRILTYSIVIEINLDKMQAKVFRLYLDAKDNTQYDLIMKISNNGIERISNTYSKFPSFVRSNYIEPIVTNQILPMHNF